MTADDDLDQLPSWLDPLRDSLDSTDHDPVWASRVKADPAAITRTAGVLILFSEKSGEPDLLFIERAHTMRSHPGQIAFPGGGAEAGDVDLVATALREAEEEVGLQPSGVKIIGELPTITIPVSGFRVTPVLGWWAQPSAVGVRDAAEVAAVWEVPISQLADPANRYAMLHPRGNGGPGFLIGELMIWGMTGYLVDNVLTRGGWRLPWDDQRKMQVPPRFLGAYPDGSAGPRRDGADR
jgi:8-oxo-dGTP pyrophosphatase MutT (NUDIX family)